MSKDAKNVPALRFKGYSDAWEKSKLKNISENLDSQRIPVTASDRIAGQIPYYGANGIQDYVSGYTHSGQIVLLAEDGANSLSQYPVHFIDGKAWVNNHAHAILANDEFILPRFLFYSFKTMNFSTWVVGGSRYKLNGGTLENLNIKLPKIEEQKLISKLLIDLDDLIAATQSRLSSLELLKKSLLQDLFI